MKLIILSILFISLVQPPPAKLQVSGKMSFTRQYCGGARPSEETMRALNQPKPLVGKKLFIRKGKVNNIKEPVIASIVTDSTGTFRIHLPKGIYCVVSENKKDKKFYQQLMQEHSRQSKDYTAIDSKCLNQWLNTPDFFFEVNDSDINVSHNYSIPCSWNSLPCLQYLGPLPP